MLNRWNDAFEVKAELTKALDATDPADTERVTRLEVMVAVVLGKRQAAEIARDFGISRASLYRWVECYRTGGVEALLKYRAGRMVRPAGASWHAVRARLLETRSEPQVARLKMLRGEFGLKVSRGTLHLWQKMADRWEAEQKKPAPVEEPAVDEFA